MRVLVIDTETTGLSPDDDRLVELGLVLQDGATELGAMSILVNPGRALHPEVERLTGLTQTELSRGVDEGTALSMLSSWMALCDVVIAWNVAFDRGMIGAAVARTGKPLPAKPWRCALEVTRAAHPEWERCRLIDAVTNLGLPVTPTHRALDDARAALAVWLTVVPPPPTPPLAAPRTTGPAPRATLAPSPPAPLGWRRLFA